MFQLNYGNFPHTIYLLHINSICINKGKGTNKILNEGSLMTTGIERGIEKFIEYSLVERTERKNRV